MPRGSGPTKFESSFIVAVSGGGDEPIGGNTPPRRWNGVTWSEETPDVARVVRTCERAGRRTRTISCPHHSLTPRPFCRIHLLAVPWQVLLAHRLTMKAPTLHAAYAAVFACFCAGLQLAVSGYYHAVTHTPSWRASVRNADHAMIFAVIAGTYTPFIVYSAEVGEGRSRDLRVLWVEWAVALAGMGLSLGGQSRRMNKLSRLGMFVCLSVMPVGGLWRSFGWGLYAVWVCLGGLAYVVGGLAYACQWPDPWVGVFGHHEVFHVMTIVANWCMMVGLEHAWERYG